jgi:hypothetical protein
MISSSQQSSDPSRTFHRAAQVITASIGHCWQIPVVPFLDYERAIVDVAYLISDDPCVVLPGVFAAETAAHFAVVSELALPSISGGQTNELILIVPLKGLKAIIGEISVGIVHESVGGGQINRGDVGVEASQSILCDRSERIRAVEEGVIAAGERVIDEEEAI